MAMKPRPITQSIDAALMNRVAQLATRLDVPKSRLLNELLTADSLELLVEAVRKPHAARARLESIQTLQQGQEIGEAVLRYLETRDQILNPEPRT